MSPAWGCPKRYPKLGGLKQLIRVSQSGGQKSEIEGFQATPPPEAPAGLLPGFLQLPGPQAPLALLPWPSVAALPSHGLLPVSAGVPSFVSYKDTCLGIRGPRTMRDASLPSAKTFSPDSLHSWVPGVRMWTRPSEGHYVICYKPQRKGLGGRYPAHPSLPLPRGPGWRARSPSVSPATPHPPAPAPPLPAAAAEASLENSLRLSPVFQCSLSHQKDLQLWAQLSPPHGGRGGASPGPTAGSHRAQSGAWDPCPSPAPPSPDCPENPLQHQRPSGACWIRSKLHGELWKRSC